jgi:hypothetical protein
MAMADWDIDDVSESQAQKAVTVNENCEDIFKAVAGYLAKSVAGAADVTLTIAEALNAIIKFTGALTGNINVIVPTLSKPYFTWNATTGAYTLTMKTVAGSGVTVTQTKKIALVCDGTNVEAWGSEV